MYVASKYEDIYPLHSRICYEKISHKAVSQAEILNYEREFLIALDFDMELVTPYDIQLLLFQLINDRLS